MTLYDKMQTVIEKRIAHLRSIHHSYEAQRLEEALRAIKELVPPSNFEIHELEKQIA